MHEPTSFNITQTLHIANRIDLDVLLLFNLKTDVVQRYFVPCPLPVSVGL